MADPTEADKEREEFLRIAAAANPQLQIATSFILAHAPTPLNTAAYICDVLIAQDCEVRLLQDLQANIKPEELEPTTTVNSIQCDVWSYYGALLMLQGKPHQAIKVFDTLYARILTHQVETGRRFHKGLPLFHMSQCFQSLGRTVHAKRYTMLALCEDAVSDQGVLNLQNSGSYGRLAWVYGLSDREIRGYVAQAWSAFQENAAEAAMPEWILQRFDQQWKTEVPSEQESGTYHITKCYCEHLMGQLGGGDGKALERLAQYLVGSMPGCRAYLRGRTFSTDHDVVASAEGPFADFRSELGRYFVCECKDRKEDKATFADVAKFCRVLDSVKAKLGVIFSPNGLTGEGAAENADREVLKVYQDRGIVIVVVNRDDLQRVAEGANFISMLREKYEIIRLDLRRALDA